MVRETQDDDFGVEITQPELVPHNLQKYSITLDAETWGELVSALLHHGYQDLASVLTADHATPTPIKSEIAKVLKSSEKCPKCNGVGAPWNNSSSVPCDQCGGSGRIAGAVPGCRLVAGVRLEVR